MVAGEMQPELGFFSKRPWDEAGGERVVSGDHWLGKKDFRRMLSHDFRVSAVEPEAIDVSQVVRFADPDKATTACQQEIGFS
jgi:hypothetical protein